MAKSVKLEIVVPSRLNKVVSSDQSLASALGRAVSEFSIWLGDNKTTFFFDYTDHGIAHVDNVLRSVESLIAESAWPRLSADDVTAVVAAVLLHDCAMHLTIDGFFELMGGEWPALDSKLCPGVRSWTEEYFLFEQEAARWDAEKLMSVFGDIVPANLLGSSRVIDDRQRALVGEFLRRNHARLAHEISINGVPGVDPQKRFSPFAGFDFERQDLYGFLARSHNMAIRTAADRIPKLSRRRLMDVHVPYAMALLRVADYIQIDAARAPTQILQLRGLKSPLSRDEWAKHHAVLELHQLSDDPEALVVIADPKSVQIYCGLKTLLGDLQRELDESWALLGEIYGPVSELRQLALTVRRVHSNLDDVAEFEQQNKPGYVPREIRLTTASAELLHLLVGPLYGNRPVVGVRELVQNALDATLERAAAEGSSESALNTHYEPLVEVELDLASPAGSSLRITDNGVGMSLETIETYFLRAGASFRRSQWWRSEFADEFGKSKVRRSGRFGVGALAAFLVGPRMTVTTRNFLDQTGSGFTFDVGLDNGLIEVSRVATEIGTSITIDIKSDSVKGALLKSRNRDQGFADWYVYDHPKVSYRVHKDRKWIEVKPRITVKRPLIAKASTWTEVVAEGFDGVYWSSVDPQNSMRSDGDRYLACNGIFVSVKEHGNNNTLPNLSICSKEGPIKIAHPYLLVDDKDGRLPLNVQRSGVAELQYPFHDALEESIAEEYCRNLYLALSMPARSENFTALLRTLRLHLGSFGNVRTPFIGLSTEGWLPLEPAVLRKALPRTALLEFGSNSSYDGLIPRLDLNKWPGLVCIPSLSDGSGASYVIGFVRSLLQGSAWTVSNPFSIFLPGMTYLRLFVSRSSKEAMSKKTGLPQYLWRMLVKVLDDDEWTVYEYGKKEIAAIADNDLLESARISGAKAFAFVYFDDPRTIDLPEDAPSTTKFSKAWFEICPTGYVRNESGKIPNIDSWREYSSEAELDDNRELDEDVDSLVEGDQFDEQV